jgi:DNA polymerase-3 subunit epsilon
VKIALLDTETTGAGRHDEVIELAIAVITIDPESGRFTGLAGHYRGLREPRVPISAGALAVHGIGMHAVRGHSLDEPACRTLLEPCAAIVAHNITFDRAMMGRLWCWTLPLPWRCSCWGFDWRSIGAPNRRLQSLLTHFGIDPGSAHRAGSDVKAMHALLQQDHPTTGRTFLWHVLNQPSRTRGSRQSRRMPQATPRDASAGDTQRSLL